MTKAIDAKALNQSLYERCGKMFWLWSNSGMHRSWDVATQTKHILPAAALDQCAFLEDKSGAVQGYCSWAFLSEEAEARYVLNPSSLRPEDWTGGDRVWFIDWIAPFDARHTRILRKYMAQKFHSKLCRGIRVKPGNPVARIATYAGQGVSREEAQAEREALHVNLARAFAVQGADASGFEVMGRAS